MANITYGSGFEAIDRKNNRYMRGLRYIINKLKTWKLISYLRQNSAFFAKLYLTLNLRKNHKQDTVLVYTMGRVGSTSIFKSLDTQLEKYSIYHIHWLNKENLINEEKFHSMNYDKYGRKNKNFPIILDYVARGFFVNRLLDSYWRCPSECKVITLTRDPVARQISSFFKNLPRFFGRDFVDLGKVESEVLTDELIDLFLNEYITKNGTKFLDTNPLTWFDEELKKELGIDVYKRSFPRTEGYLMYEKKDIKVLVIRLEDLDSVFSLASEELLGKRLKVIDPVNAGDQKKYSVLYKMFKRKLVLPNWYLEKMYTSKYANHFYSKSEITHFRNKWAKRNRSIK